MSGSKLTSKKHFLEQVVDLGHSEELDKLNLLDHLPGDALQRGQQQQQLSEATPGIVLPVIDVVFQADLDLVAHALDLSRVAQTFSICGGDTDAQVRVTVRPSGSILSPPDGSDLGQRRRWLSSRRIHYHQSGAPGREEQAHPGFSQPPCPPPALGSFWE